MPPSSSLQTRKPGATPRPTPLPQTVAIVEHILAHAPNLKAVLYECEHNLASEVAPLFQGLNQAFPLEAPA